MITVAVCTRDRPLLLQRCLAALVPQIDEDSEILVVDSAPSGPDSRAIAADAKAQYAVIARPGLNVARNLAVHTARGTIVAFVDDDVVAGPEWLAQVRASFADPSVACVTGRVLPLELRTPAQRYFEARFSFDRGPEPLRFTVNDDRPWFPVLPYHLGTGCNMAFRRPVFDTTGFFDVALDTGTPTGGGGDLDMFRRVLRASLVAAYNPRALAYHQHRATLPESQRQFWEYGKTASALVTKSLLVERDMRRQALSLGICLLLHQGKRLVRRLLRRDHFPLRLLLVEILGNLAGPVAYVHSLRRARREPPDPPWPTRADDGDLNWAIRSDRGLDQQVGRQSTPRNLAEEQAP